MSATLRIVFMGSPQFAVPSLEALLADPTVEILAVVTQPDRPTGRGRAVAPPPVKEVAIAHGIPTLQPMRLRRDAEVLDRLAAYAADLFVVVAFGQILPPAVLAMPRLGCINVHASLLPKYRGAGPIAWALARGERETGVTLMQMNEGLDTGAMLKTASIEIAPDDTTGTLTSRLAALGAELLVGALPAIAAGKLTPVAQNSAEATYARMLEKSDGRVDFAQEARLVARWIAAMDPWPGACGAFAGGPLRFFAARVVSAPDFATSPNQAAQAAPGTVLGTDGHGLVVACGSGAVSIGVLQAPSRKRMPAQAFLAGLPIAPGTSVAAPALDSSGQKAKPAKAEPEASAASRAEAKAKEER